MTPASRPFSLPWLRDEGFVGFEAIDVLRRTRCAVVPSDAGAYVVVRDQSTNPEWLEISTGGHFKQRDPTVLVTALAGRMVEGTPVLYIGKADQLRRRIDQYVRFGAGASIGHWGGRYIWQLKDASALKIAWKTDPRARMLESNLIEALLIEFGSLPLANLQR